MNLFHTAARTAILLGLFTAASIRTASSAECVSPGNTVVVDGLLSVKTLPGPPNFESIKRGDKPEEAVLVSAYAPMCFKTEQAGELHLYTFHIIPKEDAEFRGRVGKSVRVTGMPEEGIDRHHRTPVIIASAAINAVEGKPGIELSEPATTLFECVRKLKGKARIDKCGDSLSNFCIGRLQSEHAIAPQDEQVCLMQEAVAWNEIYRAKQTDRIGIVGAIRADELMEEKVRKACSKQEQKCSVGGTEDGRRCVFLYLACTAKGSAREAIRTLDNATAPGENRVGGSSNRLSPPVRTISRRVLQELRGLSQRRRTEDASR